MTTRFRVIAAVLAVVIALTTAGVVYDRGRVTRVTIAAGPSDGEAYALATALAEVVSRHAPELRLIVLETAGSGQNMSLLEDRTVDLATVQGNTRPASLIRLIAPLYPDAFQLVARDSAEITRVPMLRGKTIAIPPQGSGQNQSFWFLINHYGLSESDLTALPMSPEAANWAMLSGAVDAVFRVRAPGNPSVRELIESSPSQLVPIRQAEAMRLNQPALESGIIPRGSYRGDPPLPEQDLPTVVVSRVLVAADALDPAIVRTLTELMFERRRELVDHTPLAGFIAPPQQVAGTFLPVHDGAQHYYSRDEPSFLQENAEPIALFVTLLALVGSGLLQMGSQRKKSRIDRYNNEALELYAQVRQADDPRALLHHRARLMDVLGKVVDDAEEGRVTPEGFNVFSVTFGAVSEALRDRLSWALQGNPGRAGAGEPEENAHNG